MLCLKLEDREIKLQNEMNLLAYLNHSKECGCTFFIFLGCPFCLENVSYESHFQRGENFAFLIHTVCIN